MIDPTNINPLWRLTDPLTVTQAAALIAGVDPNTVDWKKSDRFYPLFKEYGYGSTDIGREKLHEIEIAFAALENAVNAGILETRHGKTVTWETITVTVADLKAWLESKGFRTGFFFPEAEKPKTPDYLNPNHPRYAPKLAAAVSAWMAVEDPGGKHPKQALEKWLREHAAKFGLTNEDGTLNETGIAEVAKVANWQPSGGAPKTPEGGNPPQDQDVEI